MLRRPNSMLRFVAGVALALASCFAALAEDDTDDLKKAQGTWDVVRHAAGGTGFGTRDGSGTPLGPRAVIEGNQIELRFSAEKKSAYTITFVDEQATPKQVDLTFERDGKTLVRRGIYELGEKLLKCEFAPVGEPRPARFEAPQRTERTTNLLILRRVNERDGR